MATMQSVESPRFPDPRKGVDLFSTITLSLSFISAQIPMSKKKQEPEEPLNPNNLDPETELPPDADVEERFNDFWKKNGPGIFGGIAVGALLVIGIQGYQYWEIQKEEAIQEAFAQTESLVDLSDFAEEYSGHPLSGLARLSIADARFEEESFGEAAERYADAADMLTDTPMQGRALVGKGVSLLRDGSVEAGQELLEEIALDSSILDQTRGEAAYHLAVSQWAKGDREAARENIDLILQLEGASMWSFQARSLQDRMGMAQTDAS